MSETQLVNKFSGKTVYITGSIYIDGKRVQLKSGDKILYKDDIYPIAKKFKINQLDRISWRKINILVVGEKTVSNSKVKKATKDGKTVVLMKEYIDELGIDYELV